MAPSMLVPAEQLKRFSHHGVCDAVWCLGEGREPLTSGGWQCEDELLGVPDVEWRHRYQAVRLPHFDPVGEADEVEAIAGSQVPQDGEQGVFGLEGRVHGGGK